ncbi:Ff.00g012890.m01.CDS01 [Fusarium sp. VM40]|nr:Ff.00g012890.m01.CDS01 [Fusarium sp. VM40]
MPSSLTTSIYIMGDPGYPLIADVVGADVTATTYVLNCQPPTATGENDDDDEDDYDCGLYNMTVTVGPHASKTLPAGAASTGSFDMFMSMPDDEHDFKISLHCDMSRTVLKQCTTINIGGNDDGHPTATFSGTKDNAMMFPMAYVPITVTAGAELLEATHTGAAKATTTATDGQTAADATKTGGASSAESGTETSGASSSVARFLGALSVAGIAAALVMS